MTRTARSIAAGALAGTLLLVAPACSDEDGDGATTDEELEDVENRLDDAGNEINEEIEGQDEGTNEDGE